MFSLMLSAFIAGIVVGWASVIIPVALDWSISKLIFYLKGLYGAHRDH